MLVRWMHGTTKNGTSVPLRNTSSALHLPPLHANGLSHLEAAVSAVPHLAEVGRDNERLNLMMGDRSGDRE